MRRGFEWLLVAITAMLVMLFLREQRANGALYERLRAEQQASAQWERLAKQQRVVFQHDTIRLTKVVTRWETLRDSVLTTDTLVMRDTVIRAIIATADTTIKACRETVRSCTESLRLADSLHATDLRLIATLKKSRPSAFRVWGERALWAGAVYLAARR